MTTARIYRALEIVTGLLGIALLAYDIAADAPDTTLGLAIGFLALSGVYELKADRAGGGS